MQVEKTWLPYMINIDRTESYRETYPCAGGRQTPNVMLQHAIPWHLGEWSYLDEILIHM
jgi:hypothetical protein